MELMTIDKNALAEAGITMGASITKTQGEEAVGIQVRNFPPYIQQYQKSSEIPEGYAPGYYRMAKGSKDSNPVNLGTKFLGYVISVRGKATFYDGTRVKAEYAVPGGDGIVKSPLFDEYKANAEDEIKRKVVKKNYKVGYEVLMYLPEHKTFATFFANTPTTASEVLETVSPFAASQERFGTLCSIISKKRDGSQGSWYVTNALEIEDPEILTNANYPSSADYLEHLKQFIQPKASSEYTEAGIEGAEKAEESASTARRR